MKTYSFTRYGSGTNTTSLYLVLLILLSPSVSLSQDNFESYTTKVKLSVSAAKEHRSDILSFLERELSRIDYVEIVDKDPGWEMFVVADTFSRNEDSLAVSVVVTKPFDNLQFSFLVNKQYRELFLSSSGDLHELKTQTLYTGRTDDLRIICRQIVSEFKRSFLEREKAEFAITRENLRRINPSP